MSDELTFWRRMETLDVTQMNGAERLCYVVSALFVADVENGGLWQFFYNIEAHEYEEILGGLATIGAFQARDVLLAARAMLSDAGQGALDEAREALPNPNSFMDLNKQLDSQMTEVFERIASYAASQGLFEMPPN